MKKQYVPIAPAPPLPWTKRMKAKWDQGFNDWERQRLPAFHIEAQDLRECLCYAVGYETAKATTPGAI